jgi:hypothetical protein
MNLWSYPKTWWQYPLFGFGFLMFWVICFPLMLVLKLFGKPMNLFIAIHLQAIFYNPWLIYEELFR